MALFRKSPTENTQSLVQRIEELEAVLAQLELVAETAQISWWEANLQTGAVLWSRSLLGEELLNYVVLVNDISDRKAKEAAILKLNEALQQKNEDILDSIRYAQRIQFALLPNLDELFWAYPDSFVLYRPKDIVSGDFYWYRFVGPYLYVAAIDCTGHGVPGAFMSVLGNSILNELLGDGSTPEPAQLIQELDRRVEATLRREHGTNEAVNDGMDLALVRIDRLNQHLDFAGANRPLVVLRQGQLHELRGDAFSIGFQVLLTDQSAKQFTGHTWSLEAGDRIVLFTDGISDQFGGDRAKKWGKKNFYAALEAQVNASGPEMKWSLETALDRWRGSLAQTDDVLLICLGIG